MCLAKPVVLLSNSLLSFRFRLGPTSCSATTTSETTKSPLLPFFSFLSFFFCFLFYLNLFTYIVKDLLSNGILIWSTRRYLDSRAHDAHGITCEKISQKRTGVLSCRIVSCRVGLTATETIVMEFGNFDFKKHPSKCSSLLFKREMSFFFFKARVDRFNVQRQRWRWLSRWRENDGIISDLCVTCKD